MFFILFNLSNNLYADIIFDTSGFSYDIAFYNNYAYVGDGYTGLKVLNVSDLNDIYLESTVRYDSSSAKNLLVDNGYLYLANRESGTKIYSLNNPSIPQLVYTQYNLNTDDKSFALSSNLVKEGNILYIGEKFGGLVALDVQNPESPVELGRVQVPSSEYPKEVQGVDIKDTYAFVANPWGGMAVIDISNPSEMEVVANYDKPLGSFPGVWDVGVQGDYAYILAQRYGVQVLNISDPLNPYMTSEYLMDDGRMSSGDSPPYDLLFYKDYLFVSNGLDGISFFDISDPDVLNFVMKLDTFGFAGGLEIVGSNLFYADGAAGIGIFDLHNLLPTPIPSSIIMLITGILSIFIFNKSGFNFRHCL